MNKYYRAIDGNIWGYGIEGPLFRNIFFKKIPNDTHKEMMEKTNSGKTK